MSASGTIRSAILTSALAAITVSGCARAQARATPDLPPLSVPEPPPRVVEATEPGTAPPGTLVGEPARATPPARPAPPPQRQEPARTDANRPEPPPPAEPVLPADGARVPTAPTLQTTTADRERVIERQILEMLARARANLNRISYNRLNSGARTQYNQARQFASQAEEALRERNLVLSETLAEKAATLAVQLAGR